MKSFIDIRELDILKYLEENKDKKLILFHQTNCFNTLGRARGLAGVLDKKFIEIVQADQKTIKGDKEKLGTYIPVKISDNLTIVNLYGQYNYGMNPNIIYTDYAALKKSFDSAIDNLPMKEFDKILIPLYIGSGLANGDKNIILNDIIWKKLISSGLIFDTIFFYN